MTDTTNIESPPAEIGHNDPPDDLEILREKLAERYKDQLDRMAELDESFAKAPTQADESNVGDLGDLADMFGELKKESESHRKKEKGYWDERAGVAHAFFKAITDRCEERRKKIKERQAEYLRLKEARERAEREAAARAAAEEQRRKDAEAEAARIAAEEKARAAQKVEDVPVLKTSDEEIEDAVRAEQGKAEADQAAIDAAIKTQEAADAAAAAARATKAANVKPADLTRSRGDLGSVTSLKRRWTGILEDLDQLDLDALRHYLPDTAIERAIKAYARETDGRPLKGARIYEETFV